MSSIVSGRLKNSLRPSAAVLKNGDERRNAEGRKKK
jgi:hypothetical protein